MDAKRVSDSEEYAELLLKVRPTVIKTRKQLKEFVTIMEAIDTNPNPTPQEEALSELLMS
jgi:hypothetical protein